MPTLDKLPDHCRGRFDANYEAICRLVRPSARSHIRHGYDISERLENPGGKPRVRSASGRVRSSNPVMELVIPTLRRHTSTETTDGARSLRGIAGTRS
jgi:hypothetical protein